MNKEEIEKNLRRALLKEGRLSRKLYEYELEEHIEEYLLSKQSDGDKYFFAITEHTNDVAMLLIDEHDGIYVNEEARTLLKKLWGNAYRENIRILMPDIAGQLDAGYLFSAGVKVRSRGRNNRGRQE